MSSEPLKPEYAEEKKGDAGEPVMCPAEYRDHVKPGKSWAEIIAWVKDLPPLPKVAAQALVMVENPDTALNDLVKLLGNDTALAAQVLKIANSSMFSCQREVTTLNQAIMLIGLKSLKSIVVAATLKQLNRKFGKFEQMFWENSTSTAFAALSIGKMLRKDYADELFLMGLLHDLGKLVLIKEIPDKYVEVVNKTAQGLDYNTVEQDTLGFAHPLIGALVAKKWNFSPVVCQVILHHHDPLPQGSSDKIMEATWIIQAADLLAHKLGHAHLPGYPDQSAEADAALKILGLGDEQVQVISEQTEKLFKEQKF